MTQGKVFSLDSDTRIVTTRLELEPMLRVHAAEMFPILSDSRLYKFTGDERPPSIESLAEAYSWRESRRSPDGTEIWLSWVIRRRDLGEAVGYAQATVHSNDAYIAWVIGTRWQGLGYVSESATHLVGWLRTAGVLEIRACVNPAHTASRKVALDLIHTAGGHLIGADIVEFNPLQDSSDLTAKVAAKLVKEVAGRMLEDGNRGGDE